MNTLSQQLSGVNYVVVDASLIFDALLGDPNRRDAARNFLSECNAHRVSLTAPPTFWSEIDTAIRQAVHRRGLPEKELPTVFAALDILPISINFDKNELHQIRLRAREIAAQLQQPSVYDSTYAALAEKQHCDFWTADKRFYNAAKSTFSLVKMVGD